MRCRLVNALMLVALIVGHAWLVGQAVAEVSLEPKTISVAPGGPALVDDPPAGWSHVAMISQPRIVQGDKSRAPAMVMRYAETFGTVVLANIVPPSGSINASDSSGYRLDKIAIAHITGRGSARRMVDSSSPGLDFVGGQVLSSGEKLLKNMRQVARYETAVIFDSPAVMVEGGKHVDRVVRHFVWTSARQGGLATAMWALERDGNRYRLAGDHLVWIPAGFDGDQPLSVDPSQFTLGLPGKRAFAMVSLPAGTKVPVTPELAEVAAAPQFTPETLQQLAAGLSAAIHSAPSGR